MAELIVVYNPEIDLTWLEWNKSAIAASNVAASYKETVEMEKMDDVTGLKLLFLCDLNEIGRDTAVDALVTKWKRTGLRLTEVYVGIISRSMNDWHTKTYARGILLLLNDLGATIIGKSLVEILPLFENFAAWQKNDKASLEVIAAGRVSDLAVRLAASQILKKAKPKILVLHSSNNKTSNTLALWGLVAEDLKAHDCCGTIKEIYIERGSITDCIGCPFEVCVTQAKQLSCVVGGQFVEEIMPAMAEADVLIWLCPNYNDTIGADLIAVINRMSGFYRTQELSGKVVYGVIVSGNSGTDAVANQLIGSLNLNKGFTLPPNFCLTEIANNPMSVLEKANIRGKAKDFSNKILAEICE